jgi:hypothetical protein
MEERFSVTIPGPAIGTQLNIEICIRLSEHEVIIQLRRVIISELLNNIIW